MKVRFIKKYRKWQEGDTEEFKEKKAKFLIRLGWAKEVKKRKTKELKVKKETK